MAETVSYYSAWGVTSGSFARKSCHSLFHQERCIPLEWSYSLLPGRQHCSDGPHLPLPPGWSGCLYLSKCTWFMLWKIISWTMELLWIYVLTHPTTLPVLVELDLGFGKWLINILLNLWFQNNGCCWNVRTSENGNLFTRKLKQWAAFDGQGSNTCVLLKFLKIYSYSVLLWLWFPHTCGTTGNIS